MIGISSKSMTSPSALPEGWQVLNIVDVAYEEAPHQKIAFKITLHVTNDKISEVVDSMKAEFPIWTRTNKDGTLGGEYDLARLVKVVGIPVSEDNGQSTFNYEDFRGKSFVGMVYRRPGGKYSEVFTGHVMTIDDLSDEGEVAYASEKFLEHVNYLKGRMLAAPVQAPPNLFSGLESSRAPAFIDEDDLNVPSF